MTIYEITDFKSYAILNYIEELTLQLRLKSNVQIINWNNFNKLQNPILHYHFSNSTPRVLIHSVMCTSANKIFTIHDILPRNILWRKLLSPLIYFYINISAKYIIVHSKYAYKLLTKNFTFLNKSKIKIIYFGSTSNIKTVSFKNLIREKYQIKKDEIILLYLGYIKKSKGILETVEAFRNIQNKNVKLYIVGKIVDSDTKEFLSKVKDRNIKCLGFVSDEVLADYLTISDALVNFRFESVGETSSAVMKSISFGKPIIVTNVGSNYEIANGAAVICDNSIKSIKDGLQNFCNNKRYREKLTREAARINKKLLWKNVIHSYFSLFKNVK